MSHSTELWAFALAAGAFLLGSILQIFSSAFVKYLAKKKTAGPVIIQRKGTNERAVIPDHYDSEAVDTLIKQLQESKWDKMHA